MRYTYLLAVLSLTAFCSLLKAQPKPYSIGEIVELDSKILSEKRILNIYLPQGYSQNDTASYPVIYLLDGSAHEDFLHIVGLVQFFNLQLRMPETIVVGIANVDRRRDFTFPTKVQELKAAYPTTGSSAPFMDFIEKELQPFVDKHYKTSSAKMLIGQSLGGLLATEILLKKPELFSSYLIVSPSLWWDDQSLLQEAPQWLAQQRDSERQVYISVGKEGKVMERDARQLVQVLKKSGKRNLRTDFVYLPKENHATILHKSIYEAFNLRYPYKE